MINPTPSICINVDVTNPGQFFACCGLLELADRLWPEAEGWFENKQFMIDCKGSFKDLYDALDSCVLTNIMSADQWARHQEFNTMKPSDRKKAPALEIESKELEGLIRESPIRLKSPFELTIDWFTDSYAGGSRFKTWAGRQSTLTIADAMKKAISMEAFRSQSSEKCFSYSVTKSGLPFNFDSDLGGQGSAFDIGFSIDSFAGNATTKIEPSARPFLEMLAFIGLQRFRPQTIAKENRYIYCVWNRPLTIAIAAPAACVMLPIANAPIFEFRLLYRTKYLKSFLPAIPFTGGSDE